ncbi:MAG TPA: D-glycerate dehydrogenase [Patescibacteria group bacterium]|nr:D-glycerate dehydrogenase [Patescibacteria group bacterium]
MTKPKVFIAKRIPKEVEDYIAEFCDYEIWEHDKTIPRELLREKLYDKEGILLSGIAVDEDLLAHAPKLKAVSNISVGYNNFNISAMKSRNIIGTNTPGVLDDTVADLVFSLVLSTARRIAELDQYVKSGRWKVEDDEKLFGMDVHHSSIGIIGMGRVGEAIAKRARFGFDMEVFYYNRKRKYEVEENLGVRYCDFESLLKNCDFIVLMVPLTTETYHLIDYKEFGLMKENAVFINASRGQTVNEQALIEALQNKKIFGAGLDVYETEPIHTENPLLKMANVVTVPHIGSATEKTRTDMASLAAMNLVKALYGKTPPNIVPELRD